MGSDHVRASRVHFHSDERVFKDEDRLLHVYVIGKTGTGKSTLLENMALQDLERGHGFALIDPHGDLVGRIAARVPASGRNDIISLDATELRKYRVGFTIAHQYLHQLEPDVRHAVLGNVGSVISFRVGAEDAPYLIREFKEKFALADFCSFPITASISSS
jgi:hypothetical protein